MSYVVKALGIARKAHEGQVDKAGVDYILHPITVASFVKTDEEKAVAYLHDVLEDTTVTTDDLLRQCIPSNVVDAVKILTKNKNQTYEQYLQKVRCNELSRIVKIADLKHNLDINRIPNPTAIDYLRLKKYKRALKYLNQS